RRATFSGTYPGVWRDQALRPVLAYNEGGLVRGGRLSAAGSLSPRVPGTEGRTSKMEDPRAGWRRVRTEAGPDYGIFRVRRDIVVWPRTGVEGRYVVLECPDWVNVIALTDDRQVVLIRQYRHGVDRVVLEIPSGIVERDEEPLAAAQRELAEETGYTSERW